MATIAGGQPAQYVSEETEAAWPGNDMALQRSQLSDMENLGVSALPPLSPSLEEFYTEIPTADGWKSKCKVLKPKSTSSSTGGQKHPLIVYFYGGGFAVGTPEQVTQPARAWAEQHNATVVCPSYRLAPEDPWPQGVKDAWDIVSYLSHHAETDPRFGNVKLSDGFIVGGVSAGGSIAGVVGGISVLTESDPAYAATKLNPPVEKLPKPVTGLFVAIAMFIQEDMLTQAYKHLFTSREDNRFSPGVDTAGVMGILKNLQCTDYKSPWFSPISVLERALPDFASSSLPALKILRHPRTYIQSCAQDPLRDDTVIYNKILGDLGLENQTKIDIFPDDAHAAWTAMLFESYSKNPTIKEATLEGMRWLLESN